MNVDWLIIGGGVHGVHLATRLLGEANVDPKQLLIIDPNERLLERWRRCTQITGMTYLRSPVVHHLDIDAWSLRNYIHQRSHHGQEPFTAPYERPALSLFNDHCEEIIETFALNQIHVRAYALACTLGCDGVTVELSTGEVITARHLVLSLGSGERPERPAWASKDQKRIFHLFEPDVDAWPVNEETIAVVGGGISASQVALRLATEGHRVHLISRHEPRQHQFDSDPGWLGEKFMRGFSQERDVNRRREVIKDARHRGSVPPDVLRALRQVIRDGQVDWHRDQVESLHEQGEELTLHMSTGASLNVQRVLLATGFSPRRPGGAFVDTLIQSASLPCADCGYPIVDEALRWHPRVYVSGALAELEIGPSSRNIAGARRAGDRLIEAIRNDKHAQDTEIAR